VETVSNPPPTNNPTRGSKALPDYQICLESRLNLMDPASRPKLAYARFLVVTAVFICALTFYYLAVIKIDYHRTQLLDLGWSDPAQYFAQARAMLRGEYPYLNFGFQKLPSMYPAGYSALMLPWLKVLPEADSILAPYRTNQTIGLLLLLAIFGFYCYIGMELTGGFAVALLATLPGFFNFCRSSTSELSASAFVALAFMFAYLGLKEDRRVSSYASAIFLGIAVDIRLQSLFFAPLLLTVALFPVCSKRPHWLPHCVGPLLVFLLAVSPLLVLNAIEFHSLFKTGYHFWLAHRPGNIPLFSVRYVPTNLALLWGELALHPPKISIANSFGSGTFFVPAFVVLVCLGAFFVRVDRFVVCASIAGFTFFAATTSYFPYWLDMRFYLPLVILLVAVAVLPITWAAQNLLGATRIPVSLAIVVLFIAACLGYPCRAAGKPAKAGRAEVCKALHFTDVTRSSPWFIAQRRFVETFRQQPGLVLADINPVYLNALLPDRFVALPLDGERYFAFREILTYNREDAEALVQRALADSLPVYALFLSKEEMKQKASRLPQIDGYAWVLTEYPTSEATILKLNASSQ